jgi:hypothetical protein
MDYLEIGINHALFFNAVYCAIVLAQAAYSTVRFIDDKEQRAFVYSFSDNHIDDGWVIFIFGAPAIAAAFSIILWPLIDFACVSFPIVLAARGFIRLKKKVTKSNRKPATGSAPATHK